MASISRAIFDNASKSDDATRHKVYDMAAVEKGGASYPVAWDPNG